MVIREKLLAATIHLLGSVAFAVLGAWIVFYIWYPHGLAALAKGTDIYWFVLAIDVALGPLLSLVIYSSKKPRKELIRDYCVIVTVQLIALVYGLFVIAQSRPVYIVFVKDSFELIAATQLSETDLEVASPKFANLPWWGPRLVCTESPLDPVEKSNLMFSAIDGKDIQFFPKYYRDCDLSVVLDKALKKEVLQSVIDLKGLDTQLPQGSFLWLPYKTRFATWVEIYPNGEYSERYFLAIDPYQN